jgi:hypothetical protein
VRKGNRNKPKEQKFCFDIVKSRDVPQSGITAPRFGARGNSAIDALKGVGSSAWREVAEAFNASIDTMLSLS